MNQAFQDAVEGVRAIATGLEQEIVRMDGLATARRGEEHLLQVARINRSDFEKQMEVTKAELVAARGELERIQSEAAKVLADARKEAGEILADARGEARKLIGDARKRVSALHDQLEAVSS